MITVEKCPCGHNNCNVWHLAGFGRFYQGSGFTKEEAELVAMLVNKQKNNELFAFDQVKMFQQKFGQLAPEKPVQLTKRKVKERIEFLHEELLEFTDASGFAHEMVIEEVVDGVVATMANDVVDEQQETMMTYGHDFVDTGKEPDLALQADALVDLVYVALGTGVMMGLPWQALWQDVHRANMSKEPGVTHRGHLVDCVKPPGWVGPQTMRILKHFGFDPDSEERLDDDIHMQKTDNL